MHTPVREAPKQLSRMGSPQQRNSHRTRGAPTARAELPSVEAKDGESSRGCPRCCSACPAPQGYSSLLR